MKEKVVQVVSESYEAIYKFAVHSCVAIFLFVMFGPATLVFTMPWMLMLVVNKKFREQVGPWLR